MTGFGKAEVSAPEHLISVEIKSVNNRYCDISFYLPSQIRSLENKLKEIVSKHVNRGKINVSVRLEKMNQNELDVIVNHDLVKGYLNILNQIKETAEIETPITLEQILQFKDVIQTPEEDIDDLETLEEYIFEAIELATRDLVGMRKDEGNHLEKDLNDRIDAIEEKVSHVKERAILRVPEARKKMKERLNQILEEENFDETRLESEIAILSDRLDITEEVVRMGSHITYFRTALDSTDTVGRKLNFLIQEMNREINTMGSKANDADIAHHVVEMKETLEIIREQVQNIE